MTRFLFRLILLSLAVGAIAFGIWYYMTTNQTDTKVHGTLVWNENGATYECF